MQHVIILQVIVHLVIKDQHLQSHKERAHHNVSNPIIISIQHNHVHNVVQLVILVMDQLVAIVHNVHRHSYSHMDKEPVRQAVHPDITIQVQLI